jgi:hypothetical protein
MLMDGGSVLDAAICTLTAWLCRIFSRSKAMGQTTQWVLRIPKRLA